MKTVYKIVLLLLGTALAAPAGFAADSVVYVGVSGGETDAAHFGGLDEVVNVILGATGAITIVTDKDEQDSGWKIFGGYKFNENFAVEAAWVDMGEFNGAIENPLLTARVDVTGETDGLAVAAVFVVPAHERVKVFGKFGLYFWEMELGGNFVEDDNSGSDILFGVGASFKLIDGFAIRFEAEHYTDIGYDTEVDTAMFGISYNF